MEKGKQDRTSILRPGDQARLGTPGAGESICPLCRGRGVVDGETCENCSGTGVIVEGIGGD
jgi:DnaJ-class molecular chaperone